MIWLKGLEGFLLGTFASTLNLAGLWYGIKLFTSPNLGQKMSNQTFLVVLACFVKMPVFIGVGYLTWRVGMPAPACFAAALLLVYSGLIWRVAKPR